MCCHFFQEHELKKSKTKSLGDNILNQKNNTELVKTNDICFLDEETEFLLEEWDQSLSKDDFEIMHDEKLNYNSVQVIFDIL